MRARMRWTFAGDRTVDVVLELAASQGEFSACQRMHLEKRSD